MPAMATKKKPTEPTEQEPASSEGTPPAEPALTIDPAIDPTVMYYHDQQAEGPPAPQALADTEPAPDTDEERQAFVERTVADRLADAEKVDYGNPDVVRERLGVTGVLIDGPLPELGDRDATERRAAVQLLQESIAAVYGADVAANYIAARRDDLAATSVPEILEAAATVPPADSPEAELIRDDAATVVVGAPTVAGELPSGIPDMLPPVEVRNAQRPPALKVTVPEQGFEVRPRDDAPSYYRVMVGKSLMIDGMMASFQSGQIIDDRSYSLEWLRKQGIEVVPCEAPEPYSNSL
jgi:hypothetical protein